MYDFGIFIPPIVGVAIALLSVLGSYIGSEISSLRCQRKDLTNRIEEIEFNILHYNQKVRNNKQKEIKQEVDIEELLERKQFLSKKIPMLKIRGTALLIYSFMLVFLLVITVILPVMLPMASISNKPKLYEIANAIIPKVSVAGILLDIVILISCFKDGLSWYDCPEKTDFSMCELKKHLMNKENHNGQK